MLYKQTFCTTPKQRRHRPEGKNMYKLVLERLYIKDLDSLFQWRYFNTLYLLD